MLTVKVHSDMADLAPSQMTRPPRKCHRLKAWCRKVYKIVMDLGEVKLTD